LIKYEFVLKFSRVLGIQELKGKKIEKYVRSPLKKVERNWLIIREDTRHGYKTLIIKLYLSCMMSKTWFGKNEKSLPLPLT